MKKVSNISELNSRCFKELKLFNNLKLSLLILKENFEKSKHKICKLFSIIFNGK